MKIGAEKGNGKKIQTTVIKLLKVQSAINTKR